MKYPIFRKEIPLIAVLLFLAFSLALAADSNIRKSRGKVETVDFKKKVFVLNESQYYWHRDTIFSDEKGTPVQIERLKPQASVYIEWESVKGSRKRIVKRVCIFNDEKDNL
jgi:hypothetical protein